MSQRKFLNVITILISSTLLFACGGGGGGSGATGPGPTAGNGGGTVSVPDTRLLFKSGSISMVDPDNPSVGPAVVEAGNTMMETMMFTGTLNPSNSQITGLHNLAVIYVNKDDGKLYKISALKGDPQIPSQVSNETEAAKICGFRFTWHSDLLDSKKWVALYALPGPSASCFGNDVIWKMVHQDMTATDTPIPAKRMVLALRSSNGGHSGYLAFDNLGRVVKCDQNFQSCTNTNLPGSVIVAVDTSFQNYIVSAGATLHHYNVSTDTSSALYTSSSGVAFTFLSPSINDSTNHYFADGGTILRLPLDGSTPAVSLITENEDITSISLTKNNLVYGVAGTGPATSFRTKAIKAIGKSGGAATTLVTSPTDFMLIYNSSFTTENFVYYNKLSSSTKLLSSGTVKDNGGEKIEVPDSSWVSVTMNSFREANSSAPSISRVIRIEGCSPVNATCPGGILKSFDTTLNGVITLGSLPSDVMGFQGPFGFGLFGGGDKALGTGNALSGLGDIFFYNASQANSLTRITDTPTINEFTLF